MLDLTRHIDTYLDRGSSENRFCICGNYDHIAICEEIERITGTRYYYKGFVEDKLFNGDTMYPLNCMLFFPESTRNIDEEVIREEVENLYWYCELP